MKLTRSGWLFLALLIALMTATASAQSGPSGRAGEPLLACTHPVYGSDLTVSLFGAAPGKSVAFFKSGADGSLVEELGSAATDPAGSAVFTFPLVYREWVEQEIVFWAVVDPAGAAVETGRLQVRVSNPSLFLPCLGPDGNGMIARYDELAGSVLGRTGLEEGSPGRILFNRDGSRGFVLVDTDQIGVFDPFEDRWLYWIRTGSGLIDIAATPDGSRIIVLCTEKTDPELDEYKRGSLWIYDIDDATAPQPEPVRIDPVNPAGQGRVLAVSGDSRLVYVRIGGSSIGEYNLMTGEYKRIFPADQYGPCTIKDIQVFGNCLAALLTRPDGEGFICVSNTQTYRTDITRTGWNPVIFDLFDGEAGPMAVVLHRSENGLTDVLDAVNLYSGVARTIARMPAGIRDVDVGDVRSLGVILYAPGGMLSREGLLGFFDRDSLAVINRYVPVQVDADSRVFLSRSPIVDRCYVLSGNGTMSVIDLDVFREIDVIDLNETGRIVP
jgi:hypothetical protein